MTRKTKQETEEEVEDGGEKQEKEPAGKSTRGPVDYPLLTDSDSSEEEEEQEQEDDNAGERRQRMRRAIEEGPRNSPAFKPDKDYLDWEKKVFQKHVLMKSAKVKATPTKVHPTVMAAIGAGEKPHTNLKRQVANTGYLYTHGLRQIAGFYQDTRPNIQFHYRYFLAFGTNNFVRLGNPKGFLDNWQGASLETKKNFLASYANLSKIVRDSAESTIGKLNFAQPYRQKHSQEEAERLGAKDAHKYIGVRAL